MNSGKVFKFPFILCCLLFCKLGAYWNRDTYIKRRITGTGAPGGMGTVKLTQKKLLDTYDVPCMTEVPFSFYSVRLSLSRKRRETLSCMVLNRALLLTSYVF